MRKSIFARWRASFFTGLAVALPALLTLAVVKWLFGTISSFTDTLLFFLPHVLDPKAVYENGQTGAMFWHWSLLALMLAVILISTVGVLARYYIGKRLIEWLDLAMMNVPIMNKFYGAIKQVITEISFPFINHPHSFAYKLLYTNYLKKANPLFQGNNLKWVKFTSSLNAAWQQEPVTKLAAALYVQIIFPAQT